MTIDMGDILETLTVRLYRDAPFVDDLLLTDAAGNPVNWASAPQLRFPSLSPPVVWTATIVGNTASWDQPASVTALIPNGTDVELWTDADTPAANGRVIGGGRRG